MGKKSQPRGAEPVQQRGLASFWGGARPAGGEAQQPAAAAAPVAWGAPVPIVAPVAAAWRTAEPPPPAPAPPPPPPPAPPAPVPPPAAAPSSAPRRRARSSSLLRGGGADSWCDDDCLGSQAADGDEPLVGWARDTPGAKRPAPWAPAGPGGGARPSALSTLLGLGPSLHGAARTTPARQGPPPAPAAWEQWIAAAAGPVSDGTPGGALRSFAGGADPAATPGRVDGDGARGRASAPTPGSLAAAVAAAAAAAGTSTAAPQHRVVRSAGAAPRTTGGAGSRRQQQRARLLALLEQIDAGTAPEEPEETPARAEEAPPAAPAPAAAAVPDDFPVDPRDLAALMEAAAMPPPPLCAPVEVARFGERTPLAALQTNGATGGAAAPLFPAAQAVPAVGAIPIAADEDDWASDFWEVPAPAPGAVLRVLSAADEARADGGGPARRVRLRDDARCVEYALELRDDWADTPLAPGDTVSVAAPWSFCGDATLRAASPGRLVLHPHMLLSATAVGASLACLRRAVLTERLGGGAPSVASLFGSAAHALLQSALTAPDDARAAEQLAARCDAAAASIAAGAAPSLVAVGQSEAALRKHLIEAAPHAAAWVAALRGGGPPVAASRARGAPDAALELHRVADVEEMVWAPRAGLKGQLDATVEARLGPGQPARRAPLELKTGRFRAAAEHGAQVSLYTLLLAERHGADGEDAPFGLLHYSAADSRGQPPATMVVEPDAREMAALMGARNALAAALVAAARPGGALPPVAAARSECARCFRAAECATAAAALEGDDGSAAGVADVFQRHAGHVTPAAAAFLRHWDAICGAEVATLQQRAAAPWLPAADVRRRGGCCLEGLYLHGGAAALSAPRPAAVEDGIAAPADGADVDFEYDFVLCASDAAALAAAAAAAQDDDVSGAAGAVPATLGDADADALPSDGAAGPAALSAEAQALLGRFAAGDRVLLSLAAPAGAPPADVTVLARAAVARVAAPPAGVPAAAVALLTLRCRRALAAPARCGDAGAAAWRADRDDGAGLVTRMRATLWALVQQPPPCRLRELVAELAPPAQQAPAAPRPDEPAAAAAAAALWAPLNEEQRSAVEAVLRARDFCLLRGLPGTGKTATLCAAVAALVARGASVLLACHTHSAVDNALQRLRAAGVPGLLRLGDPSRAAAGVRDLCLGGAAWPDAAGGDGARVVGATCHACGSHPLLQRRRFHVALLDEAAQVPLPLALAPLSRADAFVLVGDPAQLPPLWAAPAARAAGGEESLFARLAAAHPAAVASLTVQYRMAEEVQALANALVYYGALRCGDDATAHRRYALPGPLPAAAPAWVRAALCPSVRVALLDTDAMGGAAAEATRPLRNSGEAALAAALAAAAVAAGAPPGSLALMTPYNAQVEALRAACAAAGLPPNAVEATTVDRAQGRDLPAVVLSCVRTAAGGGGHDALQAGSLLDDARRLCVALTRAQGKMLIIASANALRAQPLTAQLLDFCARRNWVVALPPDALARA